MINELKSLAPLVVLLASVLSPNIGWAQTVVVIDPAPAPHRSRLFEEPHHRNIIQADLSLGVVGVAYERVLHPRLSVQLAAQFYRPWYVSASVYGFGGEIRPFIFLVGGPAPRGLYVSPFVRLAYVASSVVDSGTGLEWAVGATVGYSLVLADAFSARLGLGLQYFAYDVRVGTAVESMHTVYPALDIIVGYDFL